MAKEKRSKEVIEKLVKEKVCKFQYYKIDKDKKLEFGKDLIDPSIDKCPDGYIEVPPPEGLYQPKWDGDDWIEVGSPPPVDPSVVQPVTIESLQKEVSDLKAYIETLVTENKLKLPTVKPVAAPKGDKQP